MRDRIQETLQPLIDRSANNARLVSRYRTALMRIADRSPADCGDAVGIAEKALEAKNDSN